MAAELLQKVLRISTYPSLNFADSAFELAHLYYDQCNEKFCLEMGKASFECWEAMEGPSSVRTLDNMHDYALELAMLGHEDDGMVMWQEIIERSRASDALENTKLVYTYRSMAGIAEFQGDAAMAEMFYTKLITLCEAMYYPEHIYVFDYRLSRAERLSEAIMASSHDTSEWRITASCLQTVAECCRLRGFYSEEQTYRLKTLQLHEKHLGSHHKETIDAADVLADCLLNSFKHFTAKELYQRVLSWRKNECLGICHAYQEQDAEAETALLDEIGRQSVADARLFDNLCTSLWNLES